jgi:hypothetical protein
MKLFHVANPIRMFAVLCVAVTSAFVMYMSYKVVQTLSGPGWCRTALGAEKVSSTDGTIKGLDACVGLLTIQLKSLANNSYIFGGVIALCLLTLIVIVIAGGKLSFAATATGVNANIGKDALPVVVTNPKSDPVPTTTTPASPVPTTATPPIPTGPAMPEPPKV